jgi:DNA-binding NtrC family response regulator
VSSPDSDRSSAPPASAGVAEALELLMFAGDEVRTISVPPEGDVTIGRGDASAIRIDDPAVSRNHAILHVGIKLEIEDLGSANGTIVRARTDVSSSGDTLNVRQLFKRRLELAVGDTIVFGTTSLVVRHKPASEVLDLAGGRDGFVLRDAAMQLVYEHAARAARTNINVLILGETGVGKEVLARAIHAHSKRAEGPFMGVNCAALTETLQESELFGFEKGAFTGAAQARAGLFEATNGGTVFLDEVGELSPPTQAKLLRVLEERVVTRLGSTRARPIDVRFIAATNRDIEGAGAAGQFREDLFFRLNGISLLIPPLRERPGEIEPFARMFLAAACRDVDRPRAPEISGAALKMLQSYRWPGNVRELRNAIGRATVLCVGPTILPEHLPPAVVKAFESAEPHPGNTASGPTAAPADQPVALHSEIETLERARILDAMERAGGNQTRAAQMLGISRGTLISRLDRLGVTRPRKR